MRTLDALAPIAALPIDPIAPIPPAISAVVGMSFHLDHFEGAVRDHQ